MLARGARGCAVGPRAVASGGSAAPAQGPTGASTVVLLKAQHTPAGPPRPPVVLDTLPCD